MYASTVHPCEKCGEPLLIDYQSGGVQEDRNLVIELDYYCPKCEGGVRKIKTIKL